MENQWSEGADFDGRVFEDDRALVEVISFDLNCAGIVDDAVGPRERDCR